ncbi:MAG: hypothetical protein V4665_01940, partial [Patescibacteria group bacterium]
ISKETFYRTLRSLLKDEVIIKHHKIYQLNRHWLQKINRFGKKHIESNSAIDADNILSFEEGDKISYKFKNPNLMGIYWAHIYDMIFEYHNPLIPILVYHPHEWLIHTRTESESFFLNRFREDGKLVLFSIGGNTELDKIFKKEWSSEYIQINTGTNYGIKNTEYINVLGDFIFKVSVSKRFSNDLEIFFQKYKKITPENKEELYKLCNRKDPAKMIFVRSKKESRAWRAKFKKDFYITRKYLEF